MSRKLPFAIVSALTLFVPSIAQAAWGDADATGNCPAMSFVDDKTGYGLATPSSRRR